MDPNVQLAVARLILADRDPVTGRVPTLRLDELADIFEALDGWLSKGGFLPDAWRQGRVTFQEGDHVILRGGFEEGITGTVIGNEPATGPYGWRPYRFRIRVDGSEETIGGNDPSNMEHAPLDGPPPANGYRAVEHPEVTE